MNSSQEIINNYPGVALRYDPASDKITEIFGHAIEQILNINCQSQKIDLNFLRELTVKADKATVINKTQSAIKNNESWNIEYRIERNDQILWLREQGYPVTHNGDTKFDIFLQDVSEFKNMSRMLNHKLEKANEQAGLKNEFFASISHEIRTPMNAVMGMAQILAKTILDTEQKQYVSTIIDSTKSLVQIINDVLDFSKLEAGKVAIVEEEFDLEKLCLDVCHLLMTNANEKQLGLYLDFTAINQRKVIGDITRIRQVLVNLIGNAIKFTPSGYVKLIVDYVQDKNSGYCFQFRVQDTGIGISKEAQSQLFQAFAQANAQISKNFGGTGLGLRICRQLVNMMHGDIGVESIINEGTTFWFNLPLVHVETSPMDLSAIAGKKAIVVENDVFIMENLAKVLNSWDVDVRLVVEAEDLLAMLAMPETYDFFIIDKELRGLDGLKLSALIKRDPRYETVPILLLTSIINKDKKSEIAEAGVTAYTSLPISPTLLAKAICQTITLANENNGVQYIASGTLMGEASDKNDTLKIQGKALIVDDIEVNRLILNSILSAAGLVTDFAENGKVAVEKTSKENYDIIFMDCRMPVMDGFEATQSIRSLGGGKGKIPIVALTANAGEQDQQQCLDAGMSDFLSKPFIETDLLRILRQWMPDANVKVIKIEDKPKSQSNVSEYVDTRQWGNVKQLMDDEFETFALDAIKKFTNYYNSVKDAFASGDITGVIEKSHALKGMSGLMGAIKIAEMAAKIEAAGKEKELEVINLNISKLATAIEDTSRIMIKLINPELDQSVILF